MKTITYTYCFKNNWPKLLLLALFLLCAQLTKAQATTKLSFDYLNTSLQSVLADLEGRYQLVFTYTPSRMPMNYELTAQAEALALKPAIELLFTNTPIKYAFINEQILLRADMGQLAKLETKQTLPVQTSPMYAEPERIVRVAQSIPQGKVSRHVKSGLQKTDNKEELARIEEISAERERERALMAYKSRHRLAQISLLPYLGTNTYRSDQVENKVSLNIIWGYSRAINGFEMGGVANSVIEDMSGFQLAGVLNQVGGNVTGTQVAGLINHVDAKVDGLQLALVGGNVALDSVKGVQIAGLFNVARYNMDGTQLSLGLNWAEGRVFNQVSPFINKAEIVENRQVGFINICDTAYKTPIGLLSIVKKGYNRLEIGSSEELYAYLGVKLGTEKLYNIIQVGGRIDRIEHQLDGPKVSGNFTTWAMAYGLGRKYNLTPKSSLNTELLLHKVNDFKSWTRKKNLWLQFKLNYNYQTKGRLSFYIGPSMNIMWSDLYDSYSRRHGSIIVPRAMWKDTDGKASFQGWLGFTAGMRI